MKGLKTTELFNLPKINLITVDFKFDFSEQSERCFQKKGFPNSQEERYGVKKTKKLAGK